MVLLSGIVALLSACQYLYRGSEQEVSIQTEPAGAEIALSDGRHCTSPCQLTVARYKALRASVSKPGCQSVEEQLVPAVTEDATIFGTIYDYQLGATYDIAPNPLTVAVACGDQIRQPPLALTPENEALLEEFSWLARTAEDAVPPSGVPDGKTLRNGRGFEGRPYP